MALFLMLIGAALALAAMWAKTRYWSFYGQEPDDYTFGDEFDIRQVFDGPLICDGIIYGPMGRVVSRFTSEFEGSWDGNTGVLREVFHYDSGNVQERAWHLDVNADGQIIATADDVVGAGRGYQSGNAVVLNYKIKLSDTAGGYVLQACDWMYLMPNGTIMNRNQFRKFGIKVAELVATIRPVDRVTS
ncbi:MAG: DUF3833 family protein [Yoonia sp.]